MRSANFSLSPTLHLHTTRRLDSPSLTDQVLTFCGEGLTAKTDRLASSYYISYYTNS